MEHIDAFRMLGRFDYAVGFLMGKYNLSMTGDAQDWPTLLMALSTNVNEYDRLFCVKMANASKLYVEETLSSILSQAEADRQRDLGIREAEFIFRQDPVNYANKILESRDFLIDISRDAERKKKELRKNVGIGIGIVMVIILGIVIYNLPYFAEQRAFSHIKELYDSGSKDQLEASVAEYMTKYPSGFHYSDAMYMPVKFVKGSQDIIQLLDAVDRYIEVDPQGLYVDECKFIADSIWDMEIKKYEDLASSAASKKGAEFVVSMLYYMKMNNIRTIEVRGIPHLKLKEYSEYPLSLRKLMESYTPSSPGGLISYSPPKLPDDLVTIKDKITIDDASRWIEYVISALQKGFNKVLTPNFIIFEDANSTDGRKKNLYPTVTVDYTVLTQESMKGFPDIWTYTTSNGSYVVSASLYLGIEMDFEADFSIPGENTDYVLKGHGDAGQDDLPNVDSSVVYSKMCELSTRQFAEKIADELGLIPQEEE